MLLSTDGFSSFVDLMGPFHPINPGQSGVVALAPGESVTLILPYSIMSSSFPDKDFDRLEELPFSIGLSLYPARISVALN